MSATAAESKTKTACQINTKSSCSSLGQVEQLSAEGAEVCCGSNLCQDAVRERAYLLWEQAGYPSGDGTDFWYAAEQELFAEAEQE